VSKLTMSLFQSNGEIIVEMVNDIIADVLVVEEKQQEPKIATFLNGVTKSLGKGQDFVAFGKEENFDWGVLLDGHGRDKFINLMREQDWTAIMNSENPWETLLHMIKSAPFTNSFNSGSTLLMLRAYTDRIETLSIGDSGIAIYKNGLLVYKTTEHNSENKEELERLKSKRIEIERTERPVPIVVNARNMKMKYLEYITFDDGTKLAPTQALGHDNVTEYAPEVHTEYFEENDEMRCIMFSDGFGDMFLFESDVDEDRLQDEKDILTMIAQELVQKAELRWKQLWKVYYDSNYPEIFMEDRFPSNGLDDIGVIVWDNKKAV